jgi:hypothetical protein
VGPYSRIYAVGNVGLSICQVTSVPAFRVVLAMLIQKVEAPEGMVGRSGPSRVGSVITLKIRLFRWVAPPLQPGVVVPLYGTGCMAPQSFAARKSRSYLHTRAVIDVPWYWGSLP